MQREIDVLDEQLTQLSRAVRYPATPDLTVAASALLREQRRAPSRWRLAASALTALAALVAAIAIVAPVREAIADLFDMIDIFQVDQPPPGVTYEIEGREVSLAEAEEALGFEPALPPGARPSKVLLQEFGEVGAVVLYFDPSDKPGFVLFETKARVGKGVLGSGEGAQFVEGLGGEAYWLTGQRLVQYQNVYGDVIYESRRITDQNTLIWSDSGFVFRIEGPLGKESAVEIARSLR